MDICFRDLKLQYDALKGEIDAGIQSVIDSGHFISGPKVSELEACLADYVGVSHCISCANGTDALELVLRAWGVGVGDAVFVPSFTFVSTAEVVSLVGATPVFIDVEPATFNIDCKKLERAVLRLFDAGKFRPAAIIPVNLFGLPANYPAIRAIADKYNLRILEDAAQGFGGSINGKRAGGFGDAGTTSFFPSKPLGCYGDGGAIFTQNADWAALLRSLCVHGRGCDKYDNVRTGRNSRLDSLQAAILLTKLRAFQAYELEKVNEIASRYTQNLSEVVETPRVPQGYVSAWAQYTIVLQDDASRVDLQAQLSHAKIPSMVYYKKPLHLQGVYCQQTVTPREELQVSEELSQRVLSLPMHPYLTNDQIDWVCESIKRFVETR